jgi:hypothetical protein
MASLITVNKSNVSNTQTNVFNYNFPSGSVNFKKATIAVQSIIIPYSWLNINATFYNNNVFQVIMPVNVSGVYTPQTLTITIPNGFYQLSDIENYLQAQLISQGYYLINASGANIYYIQIIVNTNLNNAQLNVYPVPTTLPSGYSYGATGTWGPTNGTNALPSTANQVPQLVTTSNNFGSLIGFAPSTTFPSSPTSSTTVSVASTLVPQITPVNSLYVGCSLVRNIYSNPTNIIAAVPLTSAYATNIIYTPQELVFLPVLEGNIPGFQVIFYDQNFNNLPIVDSNLTVNLLIKFNPNSELEYNK